MDMVAQDNYIRRFDLIDQYIIFQCHPNLIDPQHFSFPRKQETKLILVEFIFDFTVWKAITNASRSFGLTIHFEASKRNSFINVSLIGLFVEFCVETIKCSFEPSLIW